MAYTPDPTLVTQPDDTVKAKTAAAEFRALKAYIQTTVIGTLLAAKFDKSGGIISGSVILQGTSAVFNLQRTSKAGGQNSITLLGGSGSKDWQLYQQTNTDEFRIWVSGFGDMIVVSPGAVSIAGSVTAGALAVNTAVTVGPDAAGHGLINIVTGANAASGYVEFIGGNGVRCGYLGNSSNVGITDTGTINLGAGELSVLGRIRAVAGFYGDGSNLTNLPAGTVTGAQVITALGYTPYNAANPSGYISNVVTALGYTPYNATNPSGYISGINSGNVTTALGFTPVANTKGAVDTVLGFTTGTNATGNKTVSTAAPSGTPGTGDVWYRYTP